MTFEKLTIEVSDPVLLRRTATGFLEIECYQWARELNQSIPMVFRFSPAAGGQLVRAIQVAVETGAIVLERDETAPPVQ